MLPEPPTWSCVSHSLIISPRISESAAHCLTAGLQYLVLFFPILLCLSQIVFRLASFPSFSFLSLFVSRFWINCSSIDFTAFILCFCFFDYSSVLWFSPVTDNGKGSYSSELTLPSSAPHLYSAISPRHTAKVSHGSEITFSPSCPHFCPAIPTFFNIKGSHGFELVLLFSWQCLCSAISTHFNVTRYHDNSFSACL